MNGGCIFGMQIVSHPQMVPGHLVHGHQVANRLLERLQRSVVIQVSNVLAYEGLAVHRERDRVFQVGAHGQNRRRDRQFAATPGAYPRERRRITGPKVPTRATESSTRRAIGRSPIKKASAISESC